MRKIRHIAFVVGAFAPAFLSSCNSKIKTETTGGGVIEEPPPAEEQNIGEVNKADGSGPVVDKTPPVPGQFTATTSLSATSFVLNWTAGSDAVTAKKNLRYLVCSGASKALIETAEKCRTSTVVKNFTKGLVTLPVSGQSPGATHFYNVVVRDEADNEAVYKGIQVKTPAGVDTTPPTRGSFLATQDLSATSFELQWTASSDGVTAAGDLEYLVCSGPSLTAINTPEKCEAATVDSAYSRAILELALAGKSPSTTYYFNVVVKDVAGNKSAYLPIAVTTSAVIDNVPPSVGTFAASTGVTDSGFTLHWTPGSDLVTSVSNLRYRVCSGPDALSIDTILECATAATELALTANATSLAITGKVASTTYYFNVIVEDLSGNRAIYVGKTQNTSADTTAPTPGAFAASTNVTSTGYKLNWTAASDTTTSPANLEYQLCSGPSIAAIDTVAECLTATTEMVFTAAKLDFDVTGGTPSTHRFFNVVVRDQAGNPEIYDGIDQDTTTNITLPGPICFNGPTKTVAAANGYVYYGGSFTKVNTCFGGGFAIDQIGELAFDALALDAPNASPAAVVGDGNDGWFIAGYFTKVGNLPVNSVAHILPDGSADPAWNPPAIDAGAYSLARIGSVLYVGGNFTTPRRALMALDADTGTLLPWNPGANIDTYASVQSMEASGTTVYASGGFTLRHGGTVRRNFVGLDATTGLPVGEDVCPDSSNMPIQLAANSSHVFLINHMAIGRCVGFGATVDPVTGASQVDYANLARVDNSIRAVVSDGAGGWYIGGIFTKVGATTRPYLAHINANGSLDANFDANVNGTVEALLLDGSTLYVGGNFTSLGGAARNYLGAVNATTGMATSWAPVSNPARTLAKNATGTTIYVGNYSVTAYSAATGAATAFNANLSCSWCTINRLAVGGSKLYILTSSSSMQLGGQNRRYVGAVDATTGAVQAWDPNPSHAVNDILVSGSSVFLTGSFSTVGGQSRYVLAAVNDTTGAATAWQPASPVQGALLAANATTLYVANLGANFLAYDLSTAALTSFTPIVRGNPYGSVALGATDTSVYLGSNMTCLGCPNRTTSSIDQTTGALTSWNMNTTLGMITSVATAGSSVYLSGGFSNIGGQPRSGLAEVDGTSGLATAWNPGTPNGQVNAVAVDGPDVVIGGSFTAAGIGVSPRKYLAKIDRTTGAATAWDPNVYGTVSKVALQNSITYVVGGGASLGGISRTNLAAIESSSGDLTDWAPVANDTVDVVEAEGSSVYATGNFTQINGTARNYLAEIDGRSGQVTAWNPNPNSSAQSLAISGSDVFAAGSFSTIGGESRLGLAKVSRATGVADPSWDPAPNVGPSTLLLNSGSLYVGGWFTSIASSNVPYFAQLDVGSGGILNADVGLNGGVSSIAVNGDAYMNGVFTAPYVHRMAVSGGLPRAWNPIAAYTGALVGSGDHLLGATTTSVAASDWNDNPSSWLFNFAGTPVDLLEDNFKVFVAGSIGNYYGLYGPGVSQNAATLPGVCRAGYYCPEGSISLTGAGACNAGRFCPTGSISANGGGLCAAGFYCPAGSANATANACSDGVVCPAGSESNGFGGACPAGQYCLAGQITGPCQAGYACSGGNTTDQGSGVCPAGYYCAAGQGPAPCPEGRYCGGGNTSAGDNQPCDSGYHCPPGSSTSMGVGACPSGSYCSTTAPAIATCDPGYYCAGWNTTSTGNGQCNQGYYCPAGSVSQTGNGFCNAGYFCPAGSSNAQQNVCGLGFYCPGGSTSPPQACQPLSFAVYTSDTASSYPCSYSCDSGYPIDDGIGNCSP